jgi:hypothetical protein
MSEVFRTEMVVNSLQFDTMMQQDDMKKYFKEKLAIGLAHKLIDTNRTKFSYTKDTIRDEIILKAEIKL